MCRNVNEWRICGVLSQESIQDRVDVEGLESAGCGQGTLLMADIESAIIEPNIGFDRYSTYGEGAVERHISPVVVVAVDSFLWFSGLAPVCECVVVPDVPE